MSPALLILDEVGYLPLDKAGADLPFQIVSQRYERGALIVTTNKAYKHWPAIFNNDAGIAAAILDRLLRRADTVVLEGKSYRMKDRHTDEPAASHAHRPSVLHCAAGIRIAAGGLLLPEVSFPPPETVAVRAAGHRNPRPLRPRRRPGFPPIPPTQSASPSRRRSCCRC